MTTRLSGGRVITPSGVLDPGGARAVGRFGIRGCRSAFVTDAIAAAGLGEGEYEIGGLPVRVVGGVAELVDGSSLAGSTLTMDAAVRNAVLAGVRLPDAVRAASETPARVLGRRERIGRIAPGADADLVVLDSALTVERVMVKGAWVA